MHTVRSSSSERRNAWIFCAAMAAVMAMTFVLAAPAAQAATAPTTTTLTLSSTSVASGTVVTFTAAVSNGSPVTAGTVTFCDATATYCEAPAIVGTAQLTSAGTAVIRIVPGIGSHSYVAIFTATTTNATSTSAAQALTVSGLFPTTTTIASSGSAGNLTLTGTVIGEGRAGSSPTGSVSFLDTTNGNSVVGSATLGAATLAQDFAPQVTYTTGSGPYGVAAGDFNGDGIPDLAVANYNDNTLSVLLGNGDGIFQVQVVYATGNSSNPEWVGVGDEVGNGGTGVGGATGGGAAGAIGNNGMTDTATVVTAPTAEIMVGSSVSFTATISPAAATGTVSFFGNGMFLGTAVVAGGVAQLTTTTLAAGTYSIVAGYSGDGSYNGSQSVPLQEVVDELGNGGTGAGGPTGGGAAGVTGNNGLTDTATVVTPSASNIPWGSSATFTAAISPAAATGTVAFFNNGTFMGTVPAVGGATQLTTTTLTVGTHSILAGYSGSAGTYNGSQSAAIAETVGQDVPVISWLTPAPITYGTALSGTELNATAVPSGGTFAYTPPAGTAPTAGSQTLSVTYTPTDTTDYSAQTATVTLTVNKATPTVTWATPVVITFGVMLSTTQLNATASVPGTFVYSPAAGTIPALGSDTLSATFNPADTTDYTTATASVTLIVNNKTTPAITWPTPAAIMVGTALNSTQLNATANVPGTFVYSPAAGTTLPAGSDILSVTFTPTDTTDYNIATATVTLTVASFTLSANGGSTQTVTDGGEATFSLTVSPVGSTALLTAVTFKVAGLPSGATATFSPAAVPAASAATKVDLVIQTSNSVAGHAPRSGSPILLLLLFLPLLGMQALRKRMQLAPRLLAIVLFVALSLGAMVLLNGCSGCQGLSEGTAYSVVVTGTSGTLTQTLTFTLSAKK